MTVLITGGSGFIGSHVAEFYANQGESVIVYDNIIRSELLNRDTSNALYNWNYLKKFKNIQLIKGDIRDHQKLNKITKEVDVIIHTAAQTAVTSSLKDPRTDFEINAFGTFNVLEAARLSNTNPCIVYCSTNKVYGDNINKIPLNESTLRYQFKGKKYSIGIPENFPTDLCEHTPYGTSKFTGDIYVQDYGHLFGLKTGIFRMSCIYGTRQFGVEEQGWVAWFTIATITGKPITIYGDGKQVRDVLFVEDLVRAYDLFINSKINNEVFNIGGGPENTLSILELLKLLDNLTRKRTTISYNNWRPSDQKVYVSDITNLKEKLHWVPKIQPKKGVEILVNWVYKNKKLL